MCLHSLTGFTWTEEFYRGSYEYSFLDHGGVIVAVSRYSSNTVYTKSITFSCTEGLSWREMNISVNNLYVIGMLTEPGSTTLEVILIIALCQLFYCVNAVDCIP